MFHLRCLVFLFCIASCCILLFLGIPVHVPLTNGAPRLDKEYVDVLKGYLFSVFFFAMFPYIFGLVPVAWLHASFCSVSKICFALFV